MGPMSMNYHVVRPLIRERELEGMRTAGVAAESATGRKTRRRHVPHHLWSHLRPFRRAELRRVTDQRAPGRERRRLRDA